MIALLAAGTLAPVLATVAFGVRAAHAVYHPRPTGARVPRAGQPPGRVKRIATTRDGLSLAVSTMPGAGPHTVIVCHGMGRSRAHMHRHVRLFHAAGHHVVAYDLRNHGESDRDRAHGDMAERFMSDLRDVIAWVRADPDLGRGRIALLALSFSTWPAVHILRDGGDELAAVICDSGPGVDIRAGMRRVLDLRRSGLPAPLRWPPLYGLLRATFVTTASAMLAVKHWPTDLRKSPTPLLFIAGEHDPIMPAAVVCGVAADHPRAAHWVAPGAGHVNAVRVAGDEYAERVGAFLAGAFGTDVSPTAVAVPNPLRCQPAN